MKDKKENKPTKKNDKIFNTYNYAGDHEFDYFGDDIKVDISYKEKMDNEVKYDQYQLQKLRDDLLKIFNDSIFKDLYKESRKKVPKSQVNYIYYYFRDRIKEQDALIEMKIFIEIADFMKINYKILYNELTAIDREKIIKNLDDEFHILEKIKDERLF